MTKILIDSESGELSLSTEFVPSAKNYYGILQRSDGHRGFIAYREFGRDNDCMCYLADHITEGNTWRYYNGKSLHDTIMSLLQDKTFSVFQFETSEELFLWVSKQSVRTSKFK